MQKAAFIQRDNCTEVEARGGDNVGKAEPLVVAFPKRLYRAVFNISAVHRTLAEIIQTLLYLLTSHCPLSFSPQATTVPSARRPTTCCSPQAMLVISVHDASSSATAFGKPQETTVPSSQSPTVPYRQQAIAVTFVHRLTSSRWHIFLPAPITVPSVRSPTKCQQPQATAESPLQFRTSGSRAFISLSVSNPFFHVLSANNTLPSLPRMMIFAAS